jgi:hypothetical protein
MKVPDWLEAEIDALGPARLAGTVRRQDAVQALRDKIIKQDDVALTLAIVAEFAGKALDAWQRSHEHAAPAGAFAVQSDLFPDLPVRLYIRPATPKALILCTGHDWDMARNILQGRTEGAKAAAEADWASFEAAYTRVRPLLSGSLTTADVADQVRQASLRA